MTNNILTRNIAKTIILAMFLSSMNCSVNKDTGLNRLTAINLIHYWDLVKLDDGQPFNISDTLTIIYYKDIILYKAPYMFMLAGIEKQNDTVIKNLANWEKRYIYLAHNKNDSSGLKYDSLNGKAVGRFSVDSFLKAKAFKGFVFFTDTIFKLAETTEAPNHEFVLEKYIPKIKRDETYSDTDYFYFTKKQANIDYSFSRELDSLKGMKLFKVKMIYNPIPKGVYPFEVPRRELIFEIKEVSVINTKEIISLLERFKKDRLNQ